jgi:hypothetical protein
MEEKEEKEKEEEEDEKEEKGHPPPSFRLSLSRVPPPFPITLVITPLLARARRSSLVASSHAEPTPVGLETSAPISSNQSSPPSPFWWLIVVFF